MKYRIDCLSCGASMELEPDEPFLTFTPADVLSKAGHSSDCVLRTTPGTVADISRPDEPTTRRYTVEEVK